MTYFEGFIVPVPESKKDEYRKHAADAAPIFQDIGVTRHFEAWDSDVPEGKVTDFRKAVDAKPDEKVVFSWFEYPDKATRDAANEKMMSDPRMKEMGDNMPFDGKRMIMGGFDAIVEEGSGVAAIPTASSCPSPRTRPKLITRLPQRWPRSSASMARTGSSRRSANDVPKGEVTDFYRAVKAEDGEKVVFSFIEWPDKATRDASLAKDHGRRKPEARGRHAFRRQADVLGRLRTDRRHGQEPRASRGLNGSTERDPA